MVAECKMIKNKILYSLIGFISFIGIFNLVSAETQSYNCPMGGYGVGVFGSTFSGILYLLIIVLIIAAIYWLIKSANTAESRKK